VDEPRAWWRGGVVGRDVVPTGSQVIDEADALRKGLPLALEVSLSVRDPPIAFLVRDAAVYCSPHRRLLSAEPLMRAWQENVYQSRVPPASKSSRQ
jgi:hypothetical protein